VSFVILIILFSFSDLTDFALLGLSSLLSLAVLGLSVKRYLKKKKEAQNELNRTRREQMTQEVRQELEQIISHLTGVIGTAGIGIGGGVGALLTQMHHTLDSQRGLLTSTPYTGGRRARDDSP